MATPTCRSCDTKFPGKDVCKFCGADPNEEPSIEQKIERAKKPAPTFTIIDEKHRLTASQIDLLRGTASSKATTYVRLSRSKSKVPVTLNKTPKTPESAAVERLQRRRRKALLRSLESSRTSGRRVKHGRVGVR